ncbi:hypothetical protein [Sphingomonas sp. R1]|uniref:hypothetical protein n=1 Tax=Sphingomonas sp. R1 TaxID=399176 RepID=UPI002225093B|nr:hypothetical protein [Sphingomonas sp. R1]UYY78710.1 hypothetical protein OIM94_06940 [Sphingomonas sp. R1]
MATAIYDTRLAVRPVPRVSWSAILAGAVIALAVELMLALLGAAIGFSTIDPAQNSGPSAGGLGIGALAWWTVSSVIALGLGSYGAARVAKLRRRFDGAAHGLAIWALTLLLTFYLLTSAIGGLVGSAFRTVGTVASTTVAGAGAVTPTLAKAAGVDESAVDAQVSALLDPTPSNPKDMTPEQARKAMIAKLPAMAKGGTQGQAAEQRIAEIIAVQDSVSQQEAMARVEKARRQFVATKNDALETAKNAGSAGASVAAGSALALFLVMLLGAGAAIGGGIVAARRTTETEI